MTKFVNKKILIIAALAAGVVSVVLIGSSIAQVRAQQHMMWNGPEMPAINGTVSVADNTKEFLKENINVSLLEAVEVAQGQVTNGTALGGHISVVQGYLVYSVFVVDLDNQVGNLVIVDAGDGSILHTSEGESISSFGMSMHGGSGHWKGHGPWGGNESRGLWHQ